MEEPDQASPSSPNPNAPPPAPSGASSSGRLTSWIIIAVVIVGGLIYLSRQRQKQMAVAASGARAVGPLLSADTLAGRLAPNFDLPELNGSKLSLAQFKGRPVVVDFWATWCGPCKDEIPAWNALQREYAGKGLVIIGVSEDQSESDVRNFLASHRFDYPVVMDQGALAATWGMPLGLPTTIFIRRDGTIAAMAQGLEAQGELQRRIEGIL